jgi:thiol-disulfide isomerase/thioredoxin
MRLSALRGKTVIVNLWATWCPPCRAEIPDMVAFYEEARKNNVEILAVNLTETESSVPNVRRFAEGMKMQFPILLDKKSKVAGMYEVTVIPTSFIIDEDGVIRKVVAGPMNQKTMRELIGKAK